MRKIFWPTIGVALLGLFMTLIVLLVWITQTNNSQLLILQNLYNTLDKSGLGIRTIIMLLISVSALLATFRFRKITNSNLGAKWGIITAVLGLIVGLLIFYAHSCCESLVEYNLGFPLSWLRAISKESNRLPLPEFQYLIQNLGNMYQWYIDVFSLLLDLFLWYCAGFTLYEIIRRKSFVRSDQKGGNY
jgi:hypothetical protein